MVFIQKIIFVTVRAAGVHMEIAPHRLRCGAHFGLMSQDCVGSSLW